MTNCRDTSLRYVPFTYAGILAGSLSGKDRELFHWTSKTTVETGRWPLFIADYNISQVSWNDLNAKDLIYNKPYESNGVAYTLRAPSGNYDENIVKFSTHVCERGIMYDETRLKVDNSGYFWGQDYRAVNSRAVILDSANRGLQATEPIGNSTIYYRPVLQPKDGTRRRCMW